MTAGSDRPGLPGAGDQGDDPLAVSVPDPAAPDGPDAEGRGDAGGGTTGASLAGLTAVDVEEPRCVGAGADAGAGACLLWRLPVARLPGEPDWVQAGWDLLLLESATSMLLEPATSMRLEPDTGDPAPAGEAAPTGADPGGAPDHALRVVDVRDGTLRWVAPLQVRRDPEAGQPVLPVVADDLVLVLEEGVRADEGALRALDRVDGRERWRVEAAPLGWLRAAVRVGDTVVLSASRAGPRSRDNLVWGLDAATGALRWEHEGWQIAVGREGVAVLEESLRLVVREPETGEERWSRSLPPGRHAVLVAGGELLHGTLSGTRRLRLDDGSERSAWVAPPGASLWRDALGEAVILVSSSQAAMLGEPGGGWNVDLPEPCCRGLQLTADEVVLATDAGGLLVLERATGALLGRRLAQVPAGGDDWFAGGLRFVAHGRGRPVSVHDPVSGDTIAIVPGGSRPLVVRDTVMLLLDDEVVALRGRGMPVPAAGSELPEARG